MKGCPTHGLENLRVVQRRSNSSAFNGYRYTSSAYSLVVCLACSFATRTKAKYVDALPDATSRDLGIR